jgi:hypothetical protein
MVGVVPDQGKRCTISSCADMGHLLVLVAVAVMAWADFAAIRGMARSRARGAWWVALAIFLLVGVAGGVWCGFCCEYQVSGHLRVFSFPVPAAFLHLEDGQWVDYITPAPLLVALFNVVAVAIVCLLPLSAAYFYYRSRKGRAMSRSAYSSY